MSAAAVIKVAITGDAKNIQEALKKTEEALKKTDGATKTSGGAWKKFGAEAAAGIGTGGTVNANQNYASTISVADVGPTGPIPPVA